MLGRTKLVWEGEEIGWGRGEIGWRRGEIGWGRGEIGWDGVKWVWEGEMGWGRVEIVWVIGNGLGKCGLVRGRNGLGKG